MEATATSPIPAVFSFESHSIRTVIVDGEPWFVAADVASVLGYEKPRNAVSSHCKGALKRGIPTSGGNQEVTIIPERDVYRLIMRSKLPSAERFEEWVVGEVLPSVRKTGSYSATPAIDLNDPGMLRAALLGYTEKVIEQQKLIDKIQPKAEIADRIQTADGLFGFRQVAKLIGVREDRLRDWLIRHDWMYYLGKKMSGKHDAIKSGYVINRLKLITVVGEDEKSVSEMFFTSKGLHRLTQIFSGQMELGVAA